MNKKHILAAAAATIALTIGSSAFARDRDHDGRPDHSWAEHHDHDGYRDDYRRDRDHDGRWDGGRAERRDHDGYRDFRRHAFYRAYAPRDRIYRTIRYHGYRYAGAPYWYRGHYVVRSYDRFGRVVLVRVDPYTGAWLGIAVRF